MATESIILMYAVGLLLGLAAGFLMHRSDYCMAGMFRDLFMFRQSFRLRALALQIVLTMLAFEAFRLLDLLPLYPFPILGAPSLAAIAGGALFGLGMVLAGGCVVGTLYKMGAGSLLSASAFAGLILGSGLYAEIHPWWAAFSRATTFWEGYITVPQLIGRSPAILVLVVTAAALPLFLSWRTRKLWEIKSRVRGYIQPWKTAAGLAAVGLFSYLLIGMPLGITTTYAKLAAMTENLFSLNHLAGLAFFQATPLNVVHPASQTLLLGEFKVYWRLPVRQFLITLAGGTLLGLASRMAPGCNIWHLMGGIPIFAMQSILFLIGLLPGAWLGSLILPRLLNSRQT